MKTLFLARHAKSNWNEPGYSDFDRPLNEKGIVDAPAMAGFLKDKYNIDLIISSDAVRALETASAYEIALTPNRKVIHEALLYNASRLDISQVVKNISDEYSAVMIVGHNPGMTEMVDYFIEDDFNDMPACGVAIVQFNIENWSGAQINTGELLAFEYPKKL